MELHHSPLNALAESLPFFIDAALVEPCDNSRPSSDLTVSTNSGDRIPVVCGTRGPEYGGRRGSRLLGAPGSAELGVSGVRGGGQALRSSRGAGLAPSGHLPIADPFARPAAASRMRGARRAGGEATLGGAFQSVHGAV